MKKALAMVFLAVLLAGAVALDNGSSTVGNPSDSKHGTGARIVHT